MATEAADLELLHRFAAHGDRDALAEVVRRYLDLVHSAAARQVRDPHVAEDVTQTVFALLAAKAGRLRGGVVLAGWLITATYYAAREARRRQTRREIHERRAAAMKTDSTHAAGNDDPWRELEPVLDDALRDVGEKNRSALLLSYFQGKSSREVAAALGISEEAARQRVSRGLEQLRSAIRGRGVAVPVVAVLASTIAANAVQAAPLGLAATVTTHAAAAASAGVAATGFGKGALILMSITKAQMSIAAGIVLLIAASAGVALLHVNDDPPKPNVQVLAAAPAPAPQAPVDVPAGVGIRGVVVGADGKPLEGARVAIGTADAPVDLYGGDVDRRGWVTTGVDGRFVFPPRGGPFHLAVNHDDGFAIRSSDELTKSDVVQLTKWGKITGVAKVGPQPAAGRKVWLIRWSEPSEGPLGVFEGNGGTQAQADADGRFEFPRVRPGGRFVTLLLPTAMWQPANHEWVNIESGKTLNVTVGSAGRPVVGRVQPVEGVNWAMRRNEFYDASLQLNPDAPSNIIGRILAGRRQEASHKLPYHFMMDPDGSFRADDIPPGHYVLTIRYLRTDGQYANDIASHYSAVTVPSMQGARSDEPLDLGELPFTAQKYIAPGDAAPAFEAPTLDGKTFRLADQKGKWVLMYVWNSRDQMVNEEVANIRAARKRYAGDARLVIVGMNIDSEIKRAAEFAEAQDMPGTHAHVGMSGPLMSKFRGGLPEVLLIGPDGKVVATRLTGPQVDDALEKALK